MIYLQLFISFFKIGLFGFGGGYAMLSLIQSEVVTVNEWVTGSEFADIVALSQMTPGPISINCATYIGYTATGSVWGSVISTLSVCLPSLILMLSASLIYTKLKNNKYVSGMIRALRPVVIGLILAAALLLVNKEHFPDIKSVAIFAGALMAMILKANPILIIIIGGILGLLLY